MWQSLFFDMFSGFCQSPKDLTEATVLAVHLFNVSKGLQCTGLSENDQVGYEILPKGWNLNQQLFSFRYSAGELLIYQKFLRISEEKINVYTIRSDQNDRIINFSVELCGINCELQGEELAKEIVDNVLTGYESEVLDALEILQSEKRVQGEEEIKDLSSLTKQKRVQGEEEIKDLSSLTKQKSLHDDDSVPFGQPVSAGSPEVKGWQQVHVGGSHSLYNPYDPLYGFHPYYSNPYAYGYLAHPHFNPYPAFHPGHPGHPALPVHPLHPGHPALPVHPLHPGHPGHPGLPVHPLHPAQPFFPSQPVFPYQSSDIKVTKHYKKGEKSLKQGESNPLPYSTSYPSKYDPDFY